MGSQEHGPSVTIRARGEGYGMNLIGYCLDEENTTAYDGENTLEQKKV